MTKALPLRAPTWIVPLARELDIPEAGATLLAVMIEARSPTRADLVAALAEAGSRAASPGILPVQISKLRDRLKPHKIEVDTWEEGWRLDPITRKQLRERVKSIGKPSFSEPPARWRLKGSQELAARLLLQLPVLTRAIFMSELEKAGFSGESIDVHISRLRDKVAGEGLVIDTVVRTGWRFDETSRERLGLKQSSPAA